MGSPVYIQIHNQLRENIENGHWKVGQKIPAERELAAEFGVSRMTLRQAIQTLVMKGSWNGELVQEPLSPAGRSKIRWPG